MFEALLVVVTEVAVLTHALSIVWFLRVCALGGWLRVALLMVARSTHVLCAVLF